MTTAFHKGDAVKWTWGTGRAEGTVAQVFTTTVSRTIKGARIRRNATPDKPAYLVTQEDGGRALKSHSELDPAT